MAYYKLIYLSGLVLSFDDNVIALYLYGSVSMCTVF